MHNPVHPGLLVKECLDDLGWTVAEAAAALHITRQQLSLVPKLHLGTKVDAKLSLETKL